MNARMTLQRVAKGGLQRSAGFTLVEVLIAMAITAFVSIVAYASLATVMTSVEVLGESSDRTWEVNRAWAFISRDLRAFAPRPVRDEFGQQEPALTGGELANFPLSFTRVGWHNPNAHPRSNLQRVNYRLEDQALWRDTYFVLDRSAETEAQSVKLLDDVEVLEVAFLENLEAVDFKGRGKEIDPDNWRENWVDTSYNPGTVLAPPVALRITLQLTDWGEMSRYYVLPPL
ncbi:MAG: GspJ family T2SS minor pseudopilin variant XcpW [Halioglobus sp.]